MTRGLKWSRGIPPSLDFSDLAVGPAPQLPLAAFQRRRARVLDGLDGALLVATNPETTYSNDVEHRFRPHSDFWYLTGFAEPGAAVLFDGNVTLFCRDREPSKEVWNGRRVGIERAKSALGVDRVCDIEDLGAAIDGMTDVHTITDHNPDVDETVGNHALSAQNGRDIVHELRLRKEPAEIDMLQRACDIGADAMRSALAGASPGRAEYEVESDLIGHYRRAGSTGPGYPAIVGTGANASILHYVENRDTIAAGDLVLVDAGCEWGYYNSDITRTVPADGHFSESQAAIYDLVHAAQQAAMAKVTPGRLLSDVHAAAAKVLADGLMELGWIEDEGDLKRHFMHGTSHFLGLDVHDVGRYKQGGESRRLEPGMVITVEPGLYANPDYAPLPAGVAPFGIRIENDVVVTDEGPRDLLAGLPTDLVGVEGLRQKG